MTNKERAFLTSLAGKEKAILQIGKESLTPEFVKACDEALEARELVKISVLKNCLEDPKGIAEALSGRTRSEVVRVIGRKIVLYRAQTDPDKKPVIQFPNHLNSKTAK